MPEFFSYWLVVPGFWILSLAAIWDGTAKDKRETMWVMFWGVIAFILSRYLP